MIQYNPTFEPAEDDMNPIEPQSDEIVSG